MYNLCRKYEGELQEKPVWVAHITNGMLNDVIYQDDHNAEYQSWGELKDYCGDFGYKIYRFQLRFRTNVVDVLLNGGNALYFAKGIAMLLGNDSNYHFYSIGTWKDGIATIKKYHLPDLTEFMNEQVREVPEDSPHLIKIASQN
jgi:hypothetical protein